MKIYLGRLEEIVEIEVERCGEKVVVFKDGRRDDRYGGSVIYGITKEEVKTYMTDEVLREIKGVESRLECLNRKLKRIEQL